MTKAGKLLTVATAMAALVVIVVFYRDVGAEWLGCLSETRVREWIAALSGWAAAIAALATIRTMQRHHREERHQDVVLATQVFALSEQHHDEARERLALLRQLEAAGDKEDVLLHKDELSAWKIRIEDPLYDRFDVQIGSPGFLDRAKARNMIANLMRGVEDGDKRTHVTVAIGLFQLLVAYTGGCAAGAREFKRKWGKPSWLLG
ncbi:hypothetical protein [Neorhizobium petrolearium]|uniref:hypothetical protein n=1 Tax=Neorhizobium petrolearium TaxID=515361 RepID=UPI003F7F52ED